MKSKVSVQLLGGIILGSLLASPLCAAGPQEAIVGSKVSSFGLYAEVMPFEPVLGLNAMVDVFGWLRVHTGFGRWVTTNPDEISYSVLQVGPKVVFPLGGPLAPFFGIDYWHLWGANAKRSDTIDGLVLPIGIDFRFLQINAGAGASIALKKVNDLGLAPFAYLGFFL